MTLTKKHLILTAAIAAVLSAFLTIATFYFVATHKAPTPQAPEEVSTEGTADAFTGYAGNDVYENQWLNFKIRVAPHMGPNERGKVGVPYLHQMYQPGNWVGPTVDESDPTRSTFRLLFSEKNTYAPGQYGKEFAFAQPADLGSAPGHSLVYNAFPRLARYASVSLEHLCNKLLEEGFHIARCEVRTNPNGVSYAYFASDPNAEHGSSGNGYLVPLKNAGDADWTLILFVDAMDMQSVVDSFEYIR